ncbi:MAG: arginine--tRNA ligase [Xanthomonadaceae bacterium]|nr:arginine--tRNA ligase [Rhodospirillaceae bacterium]NIA17850.1 arginine--tRNA ligase [Xanthomonadaceae bacterium]
MFKIDSKIENKFTSLAIKEIFRLLKQILSSKELKNLEIVYPPNQEMGNFSLPCFNLAKTQKKSPLKIAKELSKKIRLKKKGIICEIKNQGPYLNFFVNSEKMAKSILKDIFGKKEKVGENKSGRNKKIIIEYVSPNTNKPLHLGHGRNAFLGWSVSKILKANGYKIIKACLINDRGVHICKSMLAYLEKGKNLLPEEIGIKGDHFVGDYYTMFEDMRKQNPDLEKKARGMLIKWEKGDKKILDLWKKMNNWTLNGIKETFDKIGIKFDKFYFESQIYKQGKDIILKGFKNKQFVKKDKAIVADLKKYNLPDKVLLRSDGTALYITQDIYLIYLKQKDFNPDKIIHIIGSEQDLAQKQLFAIMDILGFKQSKNLYHLSYGMVNVHGGKLKSREGTRVDLDVLIKDLGKMASLEIRARDEKINEVELEKRSQAIALGALKYYILQYDPKTIVNFNPKKSLAFEGHTGPYLQYSYARISGIIKKSKTEINKNVDFSKLRIKQEKELIFLLSKFSEIIKDSGKNYDPSILAKYLYDLAKSFHSFYHICPVLKAKKEIKKGRLLLIYCVAQIIKKGLDLLGIEVLEEM